jgi:hypothetical protein
MWIRQGGAVEEANIHVGAVHRHVSERGAVDARRRLTIVQHLTHIGTRRTEFLEPVRRDRAKGTGVAVEPTPYFRMVRADVVETKESMHRNREA